MGTVTGDTPLEAITEPPRHNPSDSVFMDPQNEIKGEVSEEAENRNKTMEDECTNGCWYYPTIDILSDWIVCCCCNCSSEDSGHCYEFDCNCDDGCDW